MQIHKFASCVMPVHKFMSCVLVETCNAADFVPSPPATFGCTGLVNAGESCLATCASGYNVEGLVATTYNVACEDGIWIDGSNACVPNCGTFGDYDDAQDTVTCTPAGSMTPRGDMDYIEEDDTCTVTCGANREIPPSSSSTASANCVGSVADLPTCIGGISLALFVTALCLSNHFCSCCLVCGLGLQFFNGNIFISSWTYDHLYDFLWDDQLEERFAERDNELEERFLNEPHLWTDNETLLTSASVSFSYVPSSHNAAWLAFSPGNLLSILSA